VDPKEVEMNERVVAFFDLDKTVISVNSVRLWAEAEFKAGRLGVATLLRAAMWSVRYRLGETIEAAVRRAIGRLAGEDEKEMRARSHAFYYSHLQHRVRPGALVALEKHRELGHELILLTSTMTYFAEVAASELGFDGFLCTGLEVDSAGRLTGRPIEPLCYGKGKLEIGEGHLRERGASLEGAYFYTDSMSDVELLVAVGNPVVVNPDPRLLRRAKASGWEVVDWGRARGGTG
jgi:HAD superfamily hydrolase (TIGR01490 family)